MACSVCHLFTTYVSFACAKNCESCRGAVLWLGKVWRQVQAWAETRGSEWIPNQQDWECWCCSLLSGGGGVPSGLEQLSVLWHTVLGRDRHMVCLWQTLPDAGFCGKRFAPSLLGLLLSVLVLPLLLILSELLTEGAGSVSERALRGDGVSCALWNWSLSRSCLHL